MTVNKKTLLELAKSVQVKRHGRARGYKVTPEMFEVAIAWAKKEISIQQAAAVLDLNESMKQNLTHILSSWLVEAVYIELLK